MPAAQPLKLYADPESIPVSETTRIAKLLALPKPENYGEVKLAKLVANGLPRRAARGLLARAVGPKTVARLLPQPASQRGGGGKLSRQKSQRAYQLARVADLLGCIYSGATPQMHGFMERPHQLLGGKTPAELVRSGPAGTEAVIHLLQRAREGVAI